MAEVAPDAALPKPAASTPIEVEVIFCSSRSLVDSSRLRLPCGSSVDDALHAAGILQRHAAIEPAGSRVGIWGRSVSLRHILADGDRVEIYRPLLVEPMEARRLRQRKQSQKRAAKKA